MVRFVASSSWICAGCHNVALISVLLFDMRLSVLFRPWMAATTWENWSTTRPSWSTTPPARAPAPPSGTWWVVPVNSIHRLRSNPKWQLHPCNEAVSLFHCGSWFRPSYRGWLSSLRSTVSCSPHWRNNSNNNHQHFFRHLSPWSPWTEHPEHHIFVFSIPA